jgi:hypothetical protein
MSDEVPDRYFYCSFCHRAHKPPYYNEYASAEMTVALKLMGISRMICNPCIDRLQKQVYRVNIDRAGMFLTEGS